jgi:hypothetical protein
VSRSLFFHEALERRTLLSLTGIPQLSSLPAAPANLYLDFDGSDKYESFVPTEQKVYDLDGDITSFNAQEIAAIREIWTRVADAYSPFNLNVTTVDPGVNNVVGKTLNAVIGGPGHIGEASGFAGIDAFTSNSTSNYIIIRNHEPLQAADTIIHEAGHGFGLQHQSKYDVSGNKTQEYRSEDGLVSPVMGVYGLRSLWSDGPNSISATTLQDDMAVIARAQNGFGYRADDYGNSAATASQLTLTNSAAIVNGIIHHHTDEDWFQFNWAGGPLSVSTQGPYEASRLNARLDLFNTSGTNLASVSGPQTAEMLRTSGSLPAGTYRLRVSSTPYTDSLGPRTYGEAGQYFLRLGPSPAEAQWPFFPTSPIVNQSGATTIEMEHFDAGGADQAYHIIPPDLGGAQYRPEQKIQFHFDAVEGYRTRPRNDGVTAGEWVEFTIDVRQAGEYDLSLRMQTMTGGAKAHIEVAGAVVGGGSFDLPDTAGQWQTRRVARLSLTPGVYVLRYAVDQNAGSDPFNPGAAGINWLRLTPVTTSTTQVPFHGGAEQVDPRVATIIQTEDFDRGGEGVAYHDLTASQNTGGVYRGTEGVDIKATSDNGTAAGAGAGGFRISDAVAGEWLEYSFNSVASYTAPYRLEFRAGAPGAGGNFHAEIDGVNVTGTLSVPNTGSYDVMQNVASPIAQINPGTHVLRLVFDANAPGGAAGGFNWIRFVPAAEPQSIIVSSPNGLAVQEDGQTSFTVKLQSKPAVPVIVLAGKLDGDEQIHVASPAFTFTPDNWNVPRTVIVTGDDDAVVGNTTARVEVVSSVLPSVTFNVTKIDNDGTGSSYDFTLTPTDDAHVRDGVYASQNFGAAIELQLKKGSTGSNREILLKFDVTQFGSVNAAKLRLWGRIDSSTEKPSVAVYGATTNTGWTEAGVNWNNRPGSGTSAALSTTTVATSTPKWYEWDVTDAVRAAKQANQTTVTLIVRSLTATTPYLIFSSSEAAANRPELLVDAEAAPPPPPTQEILVSTDKLVIPEGTSRTFTVKLKEQPAEDYDVYIFRTDAGPTDGSIGSSPGKLTFSTLNWNVEQTVTITAYQDDDPDDGTQLWTLSRFPGGSGKTVLATEEDDDQPPAGPVAVVTFSDTYVRDGAYADTNFGSSTELQLKKSGTGSNRQIVMTFNIDQFSTTNGIGTAKLRLFGRIDSSTERPTVAVYGAGYPDGLENELTWNFNQPIDETQPPLSTATVATSTPKWYEWDVSNFVRDLRTTGQFFVTFVVRSLTATTPYMIFNSKEAGANKPELVVTPPNLPPPGVTTLHAAADVFVRDGSYASQNFGSSTELQLKKGGTGSNREDDLKFDLAGITSVSSAKLRLWGRIDSSTEKPSVAVFGGTTNLNWTEAGVTWNTRPGTGTSAALSTTTVATSTQKWYEWDVTRFLQSQKAAGATSVTLVVRSLTTTTPYLIFSSDEAGTNRPELVITPA